MYKIKIVIKAHIMKGYKAFEEYCNTFAGVDYSNFSCGCGNVINYIKIKYVSLKK